MDNTFLYNISKISDAIKLNNLVVFVGSGISANSGIPDWNSLVDIMKKSLNNIDHNIEPLKVAQLYKLATKKKEYIENIRKFLKYDTATPNPLHKKIFDLNPFHIVTTNFDNLLEKHSLANNLLFYPILKDNDLPFATYESFIIKMHGDLSVGNIVLTEEDYLNYEKNFPLTENFVKSLFSTKLVLFIGFSFNDYNLKIITNKVKNILDKDFQPMYLLSLEQTDHLQLNYYEDRGVKVLSYTEEIDKYLKLNTGELNKILHPKGKKLYNFLHFIETFDSIKHNSQCNNFLEYWLHSYKTNFSDELNYVGKNELIKLLNRDNENHPYLSTTFGIIINDETVNNERGKLKKTIKAKRNFLTANKNKLSEIYKIASRNLVFNLHFNDKDTGIADYRYSVYRFYKSSLNKDSIDYLYDLNYENTFLRLNELKLRKNIEASIQDLEEPYLLHKLGRNFDAYLHYKFLANKFWMQKKYVLFFICMANIKNLAGTLDREIDDKVEGKKELIAEIKKIDLDTQLDKLNFNPSIKTMLRKIVHFKHVFEVLREVNKLKESILGSKKIIENNGTSLSNNHNNIYEEAAELWQLANSNFIITDHFSETIETYKTAATAFLISHSIRLSKGDRQFGGHGDKIEKLNEFHCLIVVFYLSTKELIELLKTLEVREIILAKEAKEYLIKLISNGANTITNNFYELVPKRTMWQNKRGNVYEQISNSLTLLSKSDLSKKEIINIYEILATVKTMEFDSYDFKIDEFIFNTVNKIDSKELLEKLLDNIYFQVSKRSMMHSLDYTQAIFFRIYELDKKYKIKSKIILSKLFSDESLNDHYRLFLQFSLKNILENKTLNEVKQKVIASLKNKYNQQLLYSCLNQHILETKNWKQKYINETFRTYIARNPKTSTSHDEIYLNLLSVLLREFTLTPKMKADVNTLQKKFPFFDFASNPSKYDFINKPFEIEWLYFLKNSDIEKLIANPKMKNYLLKNISDLKHKKSLYKLLETML